MRPHHIMCVQNYIGHGYSKEFCAHMDEVISKLHSNPQIMITDCCDDICIACPENNGGVCSSDNVSKMDDQVAKALNLNASGVYFWEDLARSCKEKIFSTNLFYTICENCQWINICQKQIKSYRFYGWESANIKDQRGLSPKDYYDLLTNAWCIDTCAPRLRKDWSEDNKTLGQCSVTAFLLQDIYGGNVYGIERSGGNFHCFNEVNGCVFDLTSEQFGKEVLDYNNCKEQLREVHFAKEEKKQRYELLKEKLNSLLLSEGFKTL